MIGSSAQVVINSHIESASVSNVTFFDALAIMLGVCIAVTLVMKIINRYLENLSK